MKSVVHSPNSPGRTPVIGISCYYEQARWGFWDTPAMVLPRRYSQQVAAAGAIPVLLPPEPGVADVLSRLDALVLSGGRDIDPARYDAAPDPQAGEPCAERDAAELALFAQALSLGLPVLGICRGMQLINVARGGTLYQHLPDLVGHEEHGVAIGRYGDHGVWVSPGTRLAQILGSGVHEVTARDKPVRAEQVLAGDPVMVPTLHHQAVRRLGKGLTATAWTADGMVEAIELDTAEHPFVIGVQWHPEASDDLSLFRALAAAAAGR